MDTTTSTLSRHERDPRILLKLLVWTALVSIAVIMILSIVSFHRVFSGFVISSAQDESVSLCTVMLDQQRSLLVENRPGRGEKLSVRPEKMGELDRNLRQFLHTFSIIKIKIYNDQKQIIYCTDPKLIGKIDTGNLRLRNALSGNVDAKIETKEQAHDLAEEQLLDVDVVETYVPIRDSARTVIGSIEVYLNVTKYRGQIRNGVVVMAGVMTLVLACVFGFSYLLVRRGTRQLNQAQQQLEVFAVTDALTQISNRGFLLARGEEEFNRSCRGYSRGLPTSSLGCIMIDIDFFKRVNDTRGHQAGDAILKGVAQRLRSGVRPYDVVGRYGGEEFAVLLPDTNFENSVVVAERICSLVRNEPFQVDGDVVPITISLGVASSSADDQSLNELINRADEGLYKAKQTGRDRVAWV